jgi:hypothetical protein
MTIEANDLLSDMDDGSEASSTTPVGGPFRSMRESDGELAWLPASSFRRDSDLVDHGAVIGILRWHRAFQAFARAECAEGTWIFKLEGFLFRQWIAVHTPAGASRIAVFQASPSFNGVLELADGRAFYWDSNFWLTKWIWSDEDGVELMRVQRHLTLRTEGSLIIPQECLAREEMPLLTMLGWYLIQIVTDLRVG